MVTSYRLPVARKNNNQLRTQIYIAEAVKLIPEKDCKELIDELKIISKMLQALSTSLSKS
jgi:four helix bundle protein